MKETVGGWIVSTGVWKLILSVAVMPLCAVPLSFAQQQAAPPAAAQNGGQMNANEKLVTPAQKVDGTYTVDLVLPAWTVHNYLTLCSDGKHLTGNLREQADSKFLNNLTDAAFNNSGFVFHVQVGPGGLDFAGFADGKTITGRVAIDGKYSEFKGVRADKAFDCTAGK